MNDILYRVDGKVMTGNEMYEYAVSLYDKEEFMITDSKAMLVLRQHGHKVELI